MSEVTEADVASQTEGAGRVGVVVAATVGNIVSTTPAVSAVFSLFLVPISTEFDWPRAVVSGVLLLTAIMSAIIFPVAGRLSDRWGSRRIILFGNALFAPAIAALALADGSILQFYVLFAFVGAAGAIPSTPAYSKVISEWFDEKRGLMLGVAAGFGNGIGSTLMPIVAGLMLVQFGWRGAYVGIGLIVFLLGFPTLFALLRDAPARVEEIQRRERGRDVQALPVAPLPGIGLGEAVATSTFWILMAAVALGAGCMTAIFTHVVPMLTDRGIGLQQATLAISIFALVTAGWQVVTGYLLDKFYAPVVAVPMFAAAILGLLCFQFSQSMAVVYFGAALMGIGLGAEFGCLSYFVSRYFGLKSFGTIIGVYYAVVIIFQGGAPVLMDVGFDTTGSYEAAVWVLSGLLAVGAALILLLPPFKIQRPSRLREAVSS
jgi:MFS family permease